VKLRERREESCFCKMENYIHN